MLVPYGILSFYFENKTVRTIRQAQGSLKERVFLESKSHPHVLGTFLDSSCQLPQFYYLWLPCGSKRYFQTSRMHVDRSFLISTSPNPPKL